LLSWIIGVILISFGGFVSVYNWYSFFKKSEEDTRFSPPLFVGGILLFIGMMTVPIEILNYSAILAFLIDFYSLPIWIFILFQKFKSE
jgi:hypothetical protein